MNNQNKIWKWGCKWGGKKNPNHYQFMKEESIVIGVDGFRYSYGDYVIITEGYTVKAIALIKEEPKAVTKNSDYSFIEGMYEIPYKDWVNYAKAEWYELPEDKVFKYSLERGVAQVHKVDIKDNVHVLWNSRND